ncbi:hypothetical protein SAMN06265348_103222 [Pedobacter westerhofensis]|uniref:Uncharacterized protein n=1 Tax=Pedobacter westerhofensis TaxID=425512 RepID=A0A521C520_9SPHI|nr:hypothetical protein [Pedobacter westerhofensis]SMO54522.1 hypothetical protein SAMN06265348_103222 [Pedobacter westerhofensis]
MKKTLLQGGAVLMLLSLINIRANAQTPATTTSGNVPLKIILTDIVAITLGGTPDVTFTYNSEAAYAADQTVPKTGAFSVFSNKTYNVFVKATSAFNVEATNALPVPLDAVNVSVDASTPVTNGTYDNPSLSETNQALVTGAKPTLGTAYNINYKIPAAKALLLLDKKAATYSTNVVYTLTQQ